MNRAIATSFAFTPEQRLRTKDAFLNVFRHTRPVYGRGLRLWCCQKGTSVSRLGVIIRKKDIKHAVKRNRLRRIARDVFRKKAPFLKHIDIIIEFKAQAMFLNNHDVAQCIETKLEPWIN